MLWMGASAAERSILEEKGVFREVEEEELDSLLQKGEHILTGRNTVKEKDNEDCDVYKAKCRAVKHGFKEIQFKDFYRTYAAVASSTIIRAAVAIGVADMARFHHVDIKGAYLNTDNPVKQFMWAPDGIAQRQN